MADIYLRSTTGSDANPGTPGSAKATFAGAIAAMAAGDRCLISSLHSEFLAASTNYTLPGTAAAPCLFRCISDWGAETDPGAISKTPVSVPTGSIEINGANNIGLSFLSGHAAVEGMKFISNPSGAGTFQIRWGVVSTAFAFRLKTCMFDFRRNTAGNQLEVGGLSGSNFAAQRVILDNCTVKFAHAGNKIIPRGRITFVGGSLDASGTVPTVLFVPSNTMSALLTVDGMDLSHLTTALVDVSAAIGDCFFHRCKLGSGVALATGTPLGPGSPRVILVNCDSADTNYRFGISKYTGTETHETTIVRTGGATDGTTPISRKVVTAANNNPHFYYESEWIEFWNETVGSPITVTVPVVTDGVTLTDADAWLEVEYLGTSGFPLGASASDRASDPIFGTPANQASDTSTWTTTGLSSPVKQKLSVTVTPQEKGTILARVCVARASTTLYYDPKILDGSARQYQTVEGFVNEGAGGGSGYSRGRVVNAS